MDVVSLIRHVAIHKAIINAFSVARIRVKNKVTIYVFSVARIKKSGRLEKGTIKL